MTSNIDPTVPVFGKPTTQSVRTNFQYAHDEITALQNYQGLVGSGPFALKAGDTFTGPVLLGHIPPVAANEAVPKSYVDGRAGTMTSITAGTGLTGGTITSTGTIAANFGTTVGTIAQGNDGRFATIPQPANAAPPATGASAIGSSPNYARQDHNHASDTSRVAKSGDTMTGTLTVYDLVSNNNLNCAGNIYLRGNLGVQYAGSNWVRFWWDGSFACYGIDGSSVTNQIAHVGWVNGNFATSSWVNNNFATYGYVQGNYQANGSHYIPNQNVDGGSSPNFYDLGSSIIRTNSTSSGHYWSFWQYGSYAYMRYDGQWDYGAPYNSDARLKRNIEPTEISSLDIVNRFELVRFHWRDDIPTLPKGLVSIGFTTQQLQTIFPEAVNARPEEIPPYVDLDGKPTKGEFYDSVDTNVVMALLVGSIQQLTKRIEQLESKQ